LSTTTDRPAASELFLPPLRPAVIAQQILAHMVVRSGEPLAEECRFAGGRQANQNHALHGQISI
jgi:hypothetical protein